MELAGQIQPVIALIAGILILIKPELLNFIVAVFLIYTGVVGIMHSGLLHVSCCTTTGYLVEFGLHVVS